MAYDRYMYPMEQPGYQAPQMPAMGEWLGRGWQPYQDFGQGMAQRMATSTPDTPFGVPQLPAPQPAPQYDPSQVQGDNLFMPSGVPQQGATPLPQPNTPATGIHPAPMFDQPQEATNIHPAPFPYNPGQFSDDIQRDPFASGYQDMMPPDAEIPPSPMEAWMMDYNDQTASAVAEMKQQARNAMWIQMGQSLATHGLEDPRALSGMSQAAANYGQAANLGTAEYEQGREGNRLDMMHRMEQIRRSQQPQARAPKAPVVRELDDGTVYQINPDGTYGYNGKTYTQEQFNEIALGAWKRNKDRIANEKGSIAGEEYETEVARIMEKGNMDRESAKVIAGDEPVSSQREIVPPEQGVGEPPTAEEIRAIFASFDPRILESVGHLSDEQLVAFYMGLSE